MKTKNIKLSIGLPLDRFIKEKQNDFTFASGELSQLLRDIALAGKIVNMEVARSGLNGVEGAYGEKNVQGEEQQKLDIIANKRFIDALTKGGEVCAIISEEVEDIIPVKASGKYIIAIDPLDGSSNIDVNVSIGTIFSIYRRKSEVGSEVSMEDVLQKGRDQVVAGYLLYGSSTMLVYTTGKGVNGFSYEPALGEFFLSHPDIKMPKDEKYFSVNEGSYNNMESGARRYIDQCKSQELSARYIGSLVADFHRNLLKGGVYLYPKTRKNPNGKLRLCYECNALAMIAEQAGGAATDGKIAVLDIQPETLHQRIPLYLGNKAMVDDVVNCLGYSEV